MKDIRTDAVYFERKKMKIGVGGTSKESFEDIHYYLEENDDGKINVEMLNPAGKRTKMVLEKINKETFLKRFFSCFEHECSFFPKLSEEESKKKARESAEKGDLLKANNELKYAELEFGNALKFDETSARANYGMAKVMLETDRKDEGKNLLKKLTTLETVFKKENKHLFNEIGIDLRKQGLLEEASGYYTKAISIDSTDEALHYNLARLHKDNKQYNDAIKSIKNAMELQPDFPEGKELLVWLEARI